MSTLDPILRRFLFELQHILRTLEAQEHNTSTQTTYKKRPVFLPVARNSDLILLNLKVWTTRYCVSLQFILETLLHTFRHSRKPGKKTSVTLGLPARTLAGLRAKKYLTQALAQSFPNNENYKSTVSQTLPPLEPFDCEDPDEFVKQYTKAIRARKPEALKYKRNFRKLGPLWRTP